MEILRGIKKVGKEVLDHFKIDIVEYIDPFYAKRQPNWADRLTQRLETFQQQQLSIAEDRYKQSYFSKHHPGTGHVLLAGAAWFLTSFTETASLATFYLTDTTRRDSITLYGCRMALERAYRTGGSYHDAYLFVSRLAKDYYFSESEFFNILENNGLIDSYARNHPDAKVHPANGYRGEIGGVATKVGQIIGFNNTPAQSLFSDLILCLPYANNTQALPFSQKQLKQVLVELTRAVLIDQTHPFFSLHFSEHGKLYPVIHPAYQNTLVGDVIGMLDYYMKGFLNGGFYPETFIRQWHITENMDRDHLLSNRIDLRKYAKDNNIHYVSLRELMYQFGLADAHENNQASEQPYQSKFKTSFRIIAKQDNIQTRDNLLLADPGFDVEYTVEKMPHYEQYLTEFHALHGHYPDEYQKLTHVYKIMANEIKRTMPKLPVCQSYFHLLDVISFFCYVLQGLKNRGQLPALSSQPDLQPYAFPNSLAPYPVRHYKFFPVRVTIGDIINGLNALDEKSLINRLINETYQLTNRNSLAETWQIITGHIKPILTAALSRQIPLQELDDNFVDALVNHFIKQLKTLARELVEQKERLIEVLQKISDMQEDLLTLTQQDIQRISRSFLTEETADEFSPEQIAEVETFVRELQTRYQAIEARLQIQLQQLNTMLQQQEQTVLEQRRQSMQQEKTEILDQIREGAQQALARLNQQIETDKNTVVQWHQNQINQLNTEYQAAINQLLQKQQQEIAKINAVVAPVGYIFDKQGTLNNLQNQINSIRADINKQHNDNLALINQKRDQALAELNQEHARLTANIQQTCQQNITQLTADIDKKLPEVINLVRADINQQKQQLINEAQEDKKTKLSEAKQNLITAFKERLLNLPVDLLDKLDVNAPIIDNQRMPISTLDIADAQFMQAEGDNAKIVGGCGVRLNSVNTRALNFDNQAYQQLTELSQRLTSESAASINLEHRDMYLFKINLADQLSQLPQHYRENLPSLIQTTVTEADEMLIGKLALDETLEAINVTNHVIDDRGQTPLHYAAILSDEKQISAIFTVENIANSWSFDAQGYNPFHSAIAAGNLLVVKHLLNLMRNNLMPVLVNQATKSRYTPLMLACLNGHAEIAVLLVNSGADVNTCILDGSSALMMAIQSGHQKTALALLNAAATTLNINTALVNGQTPLHEALEINQTEVVTLLIERGASLMARRQHDGYTPFHVAAYCGRNAVLKRMLLLNASLLNLPIESGATALHLAVQAGLLSTVELLIAAGADVNRIDKQLNSPLMFAVKNRYQQIAYLLITKTNLNAKNRDQESVLSIAASMSDFELCDQLIKAGADLKQYEQEVKKSLSYYLIIKGEYQRYQYYIDADLISSHKKYEGKSAICLAAYFKQAKIYHCLQKYQPDFHDDKNLQLKPIHYAVMVDDIHFIKTAQQQGQIVSQAFSMTHWLEPTLENKKPAKNTRLTLLHLAIYFGSKRCLNYLLRQADVNQLKEINNYQHLLITAINTRNTSSIDSVVRTMRDINETLDEEGNTAMHYAVKTGNFAVVDHLFACGAKAVLSNKRELTAWHVAVAADDNKMLALLARLQKQQNIPVSLFQYALMQEAKRCIKKLEKMAKKVISADTVVALLKSAIEKQDKTLLMQILPYAQQSIKEHAQELVRLAMAVDDVQMFEIFFEQLQSQGAKDFIVQQALSLQSYRILYYLHNQCGLSEFIEQFNHADQLNAWLMLALKNKFDDIKQHQNAVLTALEESDIREFKQLIKDYPVNRLFFFHQGAEKPLLHIAVAEKAFWAIKLLARKKADPLILDSRGMGLIHSLKADDDDFVKMLHELHQSFPDEIKSVIQQVDKNDLGILDMLGSYGFSKELPGFITKHLNLNIVDKDQRNLLHKSVEINNFELMELAIMQGVSVNVTDKKGRTPLMLATAKGNRLMLQALLDRGADPDRVDCEQRSALHHAVIQNNLDAFIVLSSVTKNTNAVDRYGQNCLIMATINNSENILVHLLLQQPDLHQADDKGFTALHHAALLGKINCLFKLITAGHAIDVQQDHPSSNKKKTGRTPLHMAALYKQKSAIFTLLSFGADTTVQDKSGFTFLDYAVQANDSMVDDLLLQSTSMQDQAKRIELLHAVAQSNNISLLRRLLEMGVSLNAVNKHGQSALHLAIQAREYTMVSLLLSCGIDTSIADINGEQALHSAAEIGEIAFIRALAASHHHVDFASTNAKHETALFIAAKAGHLGCVIELLKTVADENMLEDYILSCDRHNHTAVHIALINHRWDIAELLLMHLKAVAFNQLIEQPSFKNIALVSAKQDRVLQLKQLIEEYERLNKSSVELAMALDNTNAAKLFARKAPANTASPAILQASHRSGFFRKGTAIVGSTASAVEKLPEPVSLPTVLENSLMLASSTLLEIKFESSVHPDLAAQTASNTLQQNNFSQRFSMGLSFFANPELDLLSDDTLLNTVEMREPLKNQQALIAYLSDQLSREIHLGTAKDDGDCFFDALAQLVNKIRKNDINTAKYLRTLCHEFYSKADNKKLVDEWNKQDFGGAETKNDYWFVQYTASECERDFHGRAPIWGRPNVEGVILCKQLDLEAILVIEIFDNIDEKNIAIGFNLINQEKSRTIDEQEAQQWLDTPNIPVLVVTGNSLHFVPLTGQQRINENQMRNGL